MAKVILRQEAIDDLNDIWTYTFEEWSENRLTNIMQLWSLLVCKSDKTLNSGKNMTKLTVTYLV